MFHSFSSFEAFVLEIQLLPSVLILAVRRLEVLGHHFQQTMHFVCILVFKKWIFCYKGQVADLWKLPLEEPSFFKN